MNIKNIVREAIQKTLLEDVTNFNNILNSKNKNLNESNINRMLHWLKGCDCAFITAFRLTAPESTTNGRGFSPGTNSLSG